MTNMMMNGVVAINGGVGVMEIRQPLPQTVESVAQPVENLTVNAHISLRELKNTVAAVIEKKLPKYAQLMFAIQACGIDEEGANRLPKHSTDDRYEIKSKGLVRLIYQSCGWDRTRSYRLPGVEYPQHRLVNYDLSRAIPIFEGRIDKKTQEAQRGEKALKA